MVMAGFVEKLNGEISENYRSAKSILISFSKCTCNTFLTKMCNCTMGLFKESKKLE